MSPEKASFKKRFPDDGYTECITTKDSSSSNFNLDVGWQLTKVYKQTNLNGNEVYLKRCLGIVECTNKECVFFKKATRPKSNDKRISKQSCIHCKSALVHISCSARVRFTTSVNTCTMNCEGKHNHSAYTTKHLSAEEQEEFNEKMRADPLTTPKKMTTGISSQTGENTQPARNINPILGNKDRVKYEMKKTRAQMDSPSKESNFLGELSKIMNEEFENYVVMPKFPHLAILW